MAAACALVVGAAPARAADGMIDGSPLNIWANDNGQLQVAFDGSATGEFFLPSLAPANAGLIVALTGPATPGELSVYGFLGTPFESSSAPTVTGDGSSGNPWKLATTFTASTMGIDRVLVVAETVTYVNGTNDVNVSYSTLNFSDGSNPMDVRLYEVADLFVAGNDQGTGFLVAGPPRAVGGINQAAGSAGRLLEQTAWDHYQEGRYSDVFSAAGADRR